MIFLIYKNLLFNESVYTKVLNIHYTQLTTWMGLINQGGPLILFVKELISNSLNRALLHLF